jgi:hypothetical protein
MVRAQAPTSQYFPQTGYTVRGDFLRFFNAHGGLEIFGYPLTGEFVEGGRLVQYFTRARMEARPENAEPYRVMLGPLASELGYGEPSIPATSIPPANDPNRRYFRETGHTTGYAFLDYFDMHGGSDILGFPITEFKLENGRIVQYFQRTRMEWHPEFPPGQRVQLGELGQVYATTRLPPSVLQPPSDQITTAAQVTAIRAIASLRWAVSKPAGQQTLHVYVLDQRGRPVSGAAVSAVVSFPTGDKNVTLGPTDVDGHTQAAFGLGQLAAGQSVVVHVQASWAMFVADTQTSFFVWW